MFTGLIEEVGAVLRRSGADLAIMAKVVLGDLKPGDSIAIDGACMTVAAVNDDSFVVQVSPESLARTTLSRLRPGHAVNLERPMVSGGRFGGHFVLGHVDGVGRIMAVKDQGEFSMWRFQAPTEVACYLIPKGSVAVDGISLTVVELAGDAFTVSVIPTTVRRTTLATKRSGDVVNLEADMIAKHVLYFMKAVSDPRGVTKDFLGRHGFL
jgi:riboflavin synthase